MTTKLFGVKNFIESIPQITRQNLRISDLGILPISFNLNIFWEKAHFKGSNTASALLAI